MAGVKGKSGRKSAREEFGKLKAAERIFFDEHNQEELEAKIRSGRFSLKDRFILNGMEGDTNIVNQAYKKAVPDNLDITSGGETVAPLLVRFIGEDEKPRSRDTE
jgi:hypothetical protein